jgi:hypothetical protein
MSARHSLHRRHPGERLTWIFVAGNFCVSPRALPRSPQRRGSRRRRVIRPVSVRIIVGFPPGSPNDIVARIIGQGLSERLSQPFVIESRPGSSSNVGTATVVRAPADDHTLLLASASNAINATLYERLNFNFIRDIAPGRGHYPGAQCDGGTSIRSGQERG